MIRIPTRSNRGGFTVIELLVVVGIITFLLAMIGVIAIRARQKARTSRTKALLKRVQVALDAYRAVQRVYPAGFASDIDADEYPVGGGNATLAGVVFDHRVITNRDPGGFNFEASDKDPASPNNLMDAWGSQIKYRKLSPTHMLVWSVGPDKVDQIGADTNKGRERGSLIPTTPGQTSDDISNVEVDY